MSRYLAPLIIMGQIVLVSPQILGDEAQNTRWNATYELEAEKNDNDEDGLIQRRISVPSLVSPKWSIGNITTVESWSWKCVCYRLIPSATVVETKWEQDDNQQSIAFFITIRPSIICSPTSPQCWKAQWQVTLTLSGESKFSKKHSGSH